MKIKELLKGLNISTEYDDIEITDVTNDSRRVTEGCVFVLGDNRNDSLDSRFSEIGCIRQEEILGVVRCSLFPFGFIE